MATESFYEFLLVLLKYNRHIVIKKLIKETLVTWTEKNATLKHYDNLNQSIMLKLTSLI